MFDLYGWITQHIDTVQAEAEHSRDAFMHFDTDDQTAANHYQHAGSPAAALRRCEADRRIPARHRLNPDAYWADAAMCDGCGTEGEMGYAVTENLNDCPELLDLAHAHGLTEEILAGLDRPQEGERPEQSGPSLIPDSIAEVFAASLLRAMSTQIIAATTPSPTEKALTILGPELKKITVYVPVPRDQP